jgi:hypothetical protein
MGKSGILPLVAAMSMGACSSDHSPLAPLSAGGTVDDDDEGMAAMSDAAMFDAAMSDAGVFRDDPLGALCSSPNTCAAGTCLGLQANDQDISGICSAECTSNDDCPMNGICGLAPSGTSYCFQRCTTQTDCSNSEVCLWTKEADAAGCSAVPTDYCSNLVSAGGCAGCLGESCCSASKSCDEDVTCSQIAAACTTNAACIATLSASSNAAAVAFVSCIKTQCASPCM